MEQRNLKQSLRELHHLNVGQKGGGRVKRSGKDVEKILQIETDILKYFALPATGYNMRLLNDFEKLPHVDDNIVEALVQSLSTRAETFLLSPILSDLDYLKKAQLEEADGYDTLKEMGFKAHVYTLFLYYDILLAGIDSVENVLRELKRVHEDVSHLKKLKSAFLKGRQEKVLMEEIGHWKLRFFEKFMDFREQSFLLTE